MHPSKLSALFVFGFLASLTSAQTPPAQKPSFEDVTSFSKHASEVTALAFDERGAQIVSASADGVRRWTARDGQETGGAEARSDGAVAVRADRTGGAWLAAAERRPSRIVLHDLVKREERLRFNPHDVAHETSPRRGGFSAAVRQVAFSSDGKRLLTAGTSWLVGGGHGYHGGEVKLWDVESGKLVRRFGAVREAEYRYHEGGVEKVVPQGAVIRDGLSTSTTIRSLACNAELVAVGTHGAGGELPESGEVRIWNATTGDLVRTIVMKKVVPQGGWSPSVKAVALSADGRHVATATAGRRYGTDEGRRADVRLWDIESGREVLALRGHETAVVAMTFSPDGRLLAAAGHDRVVRIWDTESGTRVAALPIPVMRINAVTFSPDGKLLAAGGGDEANRSRVQVWSCPTR